MGDLGMPSRILGGKYGAPFTYAAFNKERTLAPGMLADVVVLDEGFRVRGVMRSGVWHVGEAPD